MKPIGSDGLATPLLSCHRLHVARGAHGNSDATRIFDHEQIEDGKEAIEFVAQSATWTLAIPA
jgi:hypothetical protein